ncbi:hypothetical protein SCHPADRAFT_897200 [Schizopora paradoxa]|uniref:Uncharacterized protein n=1 Tax=Schizopora paradoxa TaxID=27342 RepID=A0A0H2QXW1_9AGAM|nr:hypothetical protein SCHPADRAFT_897200 [Schizopora paradoxa]
MRKRFASEEGSPADLDEGHRVRYRRPIPGLVPCANCSNPRELEPQLRLRYWHRCSRYDNQWSSCDELMIVLESTISLRESHTGVPYAIRLGQAAPNACNVCYRALLRRRRYEFSDLPPSPIAVIFTYYRGILTFFILHVPALDDDDDDRVLNSFEGGFRFNRKDAIQTSLFSVGIVSPSRDRFEDGIV